MAVPSTQSRLPVVAALTALTIGASLWLERELYWVLSPTEVAKSHYAPNPVVESLEIARYVREHTTGDDSIAIIGSEPQIYFYAHRRAATKYLYTYPLMESHSFVQRMQQEMCRELDEAAPRILVYVNVAMSWGTFPDPQQEIYQCCDRIMRERYQLAGVVDIQSYRHTEYRWDKSAAGYEPKSKYFLLVYVRKQAA
jgi:hypothetical protein